MGLGEGLAGGGERGLGPGESEAEAHRIEHEQCGTLAHELPVLERDRDDGAGYFRGDIDHLGKHPRIARPGCQHVAVPQYADRDRGAGDHQQREEEAEEEDEMAHRVSSGTSAR
jgi:hypothetical protein